MAVEMHITDFTVPSNKSTQSFKVRKSRSASLIRMNCVDFLM